MPPRPKDTAVFAKQIDDIITLDPGECYELSGIEMCTNIYDRLLRYEAEDLTKLVGGVAEFLDRLAGRQDLHLQDPPEPQIPVRRAGDRRGRGVFPAACRADGQDVGLPVDPARLVEDHRQGSREGGDTLPQDHRGFRPLLVLNLMTSIVASVVEKKVALANETNGDLGNGWLKTHSAASGAFKLVAWKANESVSLEAYPGFRLGAPQLKRVVVRHVPEPASQRLLLEKADADYRPRPDAGPDQAAGQQRRTSRWSPSRPPTPSTWA